MLRIVAGLTGIYLLATMLASLVCRLVYIHNLTIPYGW